ncbi:MAG: efflux RND transporter periplasmic adaptor subunit, partial [Desulfatiglandales bacterium]
KVPSQAEVDIALANVGKAEAVVLQAKAQISKAEADLRFNQTNLSKAVIRSPLNGIVLARKVEPGQTVAASLQTPVLFTIAEDLKKMELKVDVDEADIGKVEVGQQAQFTVDAYPEKRFDGRVKEIRLSPKTTQGIVTYETLLDVENPELLLKPGMTATAEIVVRQVKDALLIPNSALRFTPPKTTAPSQFQKRGILGAVFPFRPSPQVPEKSEHKKNKAERLIYKLEGDRLAEVKVLIGDTDGKYTEIRSGELKEGDLVAVGIAQREDAK